MLGPQATMKWCPCKSQVCFNKICRRYDWQKVRNVARLPAFSVGKPIPARKPSSWAWSSGPAGPNECFLGDLEWESAFQLIPHQGLFEPGRGPQQLSTGRGRPSAADRLLFSSGFQ